MLKHETEENITEYLKQQGVTAFKRFTIKKDGNLIETNILLLTFNTTSLPKSLKKIFTELYRLKCTFQILCGVSTARGLDIMRTVVLNYLDQSVKNVGWVILITLHVLAKMKPSAWTVTNLTYQNQINVKFGKKSKKLWKLKLHKKSLIWKLKKNQENQTEITFAKVVQSLNTKPETQNIYSV